MSRRASNPVEKIEEMRNLLAFLLVGAFICMLPMFAFIIIPAENKEVIVYMVGQLSGMALTALGFYFVNKVGQDALDAQRTENTAKAFDAIASVKGPTGTPEDPLIVAGPGSTSSAPPVQTETNNEDPRSS